MVNSNSSKSCKKCPIIQMNELALASQQRGSWASPAFSEDVQNLPQAAAGFGTKTEYQDFQGRWQRCPLVPSTHHAEPGALWATFRNLSLCFLSTLENLTGSYFHHTEILNIALKTLKFSNSLLYGKFHILRVLSMEFYCFSRVFYWF